MTDSLRSVVLEVMAFDRLPVASFDMSGGNAGSPTPATNARRLALAVAAALHNPGTNLLEAPRTPSIFKSGATALLAATDTALWTPAAGKKFRLMLLVVAHSVASDLIFKDNNAGAQFGEMALTAAGQPVPVALPDNGFFSAAANNTLSARAANAGTLTWWAVGTEE